jgi:hypothetical protein
MNINIPNCVPAYNMDLEESQRHEYQLERIEQDKALFNSHLKTPGAGKIYYYDMLADCDTCEHLRGPFYIDIHDYDGCHICLNAQCRVRRYAANRNRLNDEMVDKLDQILNRSEQNIVCDICNRRSDFLEIRDAITGDIIQGFVCYERQCTKGNSNRPEIPDGESLPF